MKVSQEKPLPREMRSMYPDLSQNATSVMTTLVLFHAQNDFIKSVSGDSQVEYELYLNQVAEIVHYPMQPIHNIVMINEQTRSRTIPPTPNKIERNKTIGEPYCLRGTSGAAVYPPLMSSISSYVVNMPNINLHVIEGTCDDTPERHQVFAESWSEHIIGRTSPYEWESHEILIAGIFEHMCSLNAIEFVLKRLVEDIQTEGRPHTIKMIMPTLHETKNANITNIMTNVVETMSKDIASVKITRSHVSDFGVICPASEPGEIRTYVMEQKKIQQQVNLFSCRVARKDQTKQLSDVYSNCQGTDRLFSDDGKIQCVFNMKYPETDGGENINRTLYDAPDTTWVEKLYKPYALLTPGAKYRTTNSLKHYLLPWHTNPVHTFDTFDTYNADAQDAMFVRGLGKLGKWGANQAADMIRYFKGNGGVYVLIIKRANGMWAVPGGIVDADESAADAALREYCEEVRGASTTGFKIEPAMLKEFWGDNLNEGKAHVVYRGYSADPRNTYDAWIETTCFASAANTLDELLADAKKCRDYWTNPTRGYKEVLDARVIRLTPDGAIKLQVGEWTQLNSIKKGSNSDEIRETIERNGFFAAHAMLLNTFITQLNLEQQKPASPSTQMSGKPLGNQKTQRKSVPSIIRGQPSDPQADQSQSGNYEKLTL